MNETAVAGMIFVLLMTGMVGGFVLLFPLSRRLAAYLEQRVRGADGTAPDELRELRETVRSLQERLGRMEERQEFLESLAAEPPSRALPAARGRPE